MKTLLRTVLIIMGISLNYSCHKNHNSGGKIEELILSINTKNKNQLESLLSHKCKIITNGIVSKNNGIITLSQNIDYLSSFKNITKLAVNKLIRSDSINVSKWSVILAKDEAIGDGILITTFENDSISCIEIIFSKTKYIQDTIYDSTYTRIQNVEKKSKVNSDLYWYYLRNSSGGFYDEAGLHYSQILVCSSAVTTPGSFTKVDAVGPFQNFNDAIMARRSDLEIAIQAGIKLILNTAICDHRWD